MLNSIKAILGISVVATECGHKTKLAFTINHEGHFIDCIRTEKGNPRYCKECFSEAIIQCAWCGNPILPGHPITLYTPKEGVEMPKYAVKYSDEPLQYVGCLGWECASSGMDRAGFWIMPGVVHRVPSPIEMMLHANSEGNSSAAVVCSDLSDPNNIGTVFKA